MAITPTGAPPWVRTNDLESYGGHLSKINFQSQGAIDPTSDVSAEQFSRLAEDVAELARVTEFATLTYTNNDAAPAVPTVLYYDALAGAEPTSVRVGTGHVIFFWDAAYTDAYGVSGLLHIAHAEASVHGNGTAAIVTVEPYDSDSDGYNDAVRVRTFTDAGGTLGDRTITLVIATSPV